MKQDSTLTTAVKALRFSQQFVFVACLTAVLAYPASAQNESAKSQEQTPTGVLIVPPINPPPSYFGPRYEPDLEHEEQTKKIVQMLKDADRLLNKGQLDTAITQFREILEVRKTWSAYEGLIKAHNLKNDPASVVQTYREWIYGTSDKTTTSYGSTDVERLLNFALVLHKAGHRDEAMSAYRKGLQHLNFNGDSPRPNYEVPFLVTFDGRNSENAYTPARFEGAIYTALGMKKTQNIFDKEALPLLEQAVQTDPRSAVARYYLGGVLLRTVPGYGDSPTGDEVYSRSIAQFDEALRLGGNRFRAPVKLLRDNFYRFPSSSKAKTTVKK